MKTALLLIDLQNDYFPEGKMELEGSLQAVQQSRLLLDQARRLNWPRLHIQHLSIRPGATFFLPNTQGVLIHPLVAPLPGEVLIQKNYPNSFRGTSLLAELQNQQVERLIITGMMTHMCVDATVRAANDLGFEILLAHDACATRSLTFGETNVPAAAVHAAFLAALKSYASVLSVKEILETPE